MKIIEKYSHLNGWEFLQVHKPYLWHEITTIILEVNANKLKTKVSKEKRSKGTLFFSPKDLNNEFKRLYNERGWQESRVSYWVTADAQLIRKTFTLPPDE